MTAGARLPTPDGRVAATTLAPPAWVGVVALLDGYPLPGTVAGGAGAVAAGLALAAVGVTAWWTLDRGLVLPAALATLALVAAAAWALAAPGVGAARVGRSMVVTGDPVPSRFAGVAPLLVVVCGCAALVEGTVRGAASASLGRLAPAGAGRPAALGWAGAGGATLVVLSLAPGVLLGSPVASPALLGYAAAGGGLGGVAVGYLHLRHRLVAPTVVLGVVAGAAMVGVTRGGSPQGFPLAWPVWLVPALALGGVEGAWRRLRGWLGGR